MQCPDCGLNRYHPKRKILHGVRVGKDVMRAYSTLVLLLLVGCAEFLPPEDWKALDPPGQYRVWYQEAEQCLNARRAFEDIVWRAVQATTFGCGGRDDAVGCLVLPYTIYLAQLTLGSELVVKTEIIHYIRQNGLHDNLLLRCGGIM